MSDQSEIASSEAVVKFWFEELSEQDWFGGDAALDAQIARRFAATHLAVARNRGAEWQIDAQARLAAIIVLDQFPRNIYRGTGLAFATDGLALTLAKEAVELGADQALHARMRAFFYVPFEHSENLADQDRSVALFSTLDNPQYLDFAQRHRDVIADYGRFPHRNAFLGRQSSPKELAYLAQPGAGF